MKRTPVCLLIVFLFASSLFGADWDANDDTFDPTIHSVVIGNASWLGDPSPFVVSELSRTGYTHVNATKWEGFDPSINISLIVPLQPGDKKPAAGGMLMFDSAKAAHVAKVFSDALKSDPSKDSKPVSLKTSLDNADWVLSSTSDKQGKRSFQLISKTKEGTSTFRFSHNAFKKLLGAFEHSRNSMNAKPDK